MSWVMRLPGVPEGGESGRHTSLTEAPAAAAARWQSSNSGWTL
jgi:hypothetical protein